MIDNCLLYFLYSIIVLSILIIILLSSDFNNESSLIPFISTIGLGGILTVSSKYFSNNSNNNIKSGSLDNDLAKLLNIPNNIENIELDCEKEINNLKQKKQNNEMAMKNIENDMNTYLSDIYKNKITNWYNPDIDLNNRPIIQILNYNKNKIIKDKIISTMQNKITDEIYSSSPKFTQSLNTAYAFPTEYFNKDIIDKFRRSNKNKKPENVFTQMAFQDKSIIVKQLNNIGVVKSTIDKMQNYIDILAKFTQSIKNFKINNELENITIQNKLLEAININDIDSYNNLNKNYDLILQNISDIIKEYRNMQNTNNSIEFEINQLEEPCNKEKNEIINKYKPFMDCSNCFDLIKDKIFELKQKLEESSSKIQLENKELTQLTSHLETQQLQLNTKLQNQKVILQNQNKEIEQLSSENNNNKITIQKLTQEVDELTNKLNSSQENELKLNELIKKNNIIISELTTKIKQNDAEITAITINNKTLQDEIIILNNTIIELEKKIKEYQTKELELNNTKEQLNRWAIRLSKEQNELYDNEIGLKQQKEKLTEQNKILISELTKLKQYIEDLELNDKTTLLNSAEEKINKLEDKIRTYESEYSKIQKIQIELQKKLKSYNNVKESLCSLIDSHYQEYNLKNIEQNKLIQQLKNINNESKEINFDTIEFTNNELLIIKKYYMEIIKLENQKESELYIINQLYNLVDIFQIECSIIENTTFSRSSEYLDEIITKYLNALQTNSNLKNINQQLEVEKQELQQKTKEQLDQYLLKFNKDEFNKLQSDNYQLNKQLSDLFDKNEKLNKEIEQLKSEKNQLLIVQNEKNKLISQINSDINEKESKINILNNQIEYFEKSNERFFKNVISKLEQFLKKISTNLLDNINKNIKKNSLEYYNELFNSLFNYINSLKPELEKLKTDNEELLKTVGLKNVIIDQKDDEIKRLEELLSKCDLISSTNKELNDKIIELNNLLKKEDTNKDINISLQIEIDKLKQEFISIKEFLFNNFKNILNENSLIYPPNIEVNQYINQIYNLVKNEIDRLKTNFDMNNQKLLSQIDELELRLSNQKITFNSEIQVYKTSITELEQQIQLLQNNQTNIINKELEPLIKNYENKKKEYKIELEKIKNNQWTIGTALSEKEKAQQELQTALENIQSNSNIINIYKLQIKKLQNELGYNSNLPLEELINQIIINFKNYQLQEVKLSSLLINNKELKEQLQQLQNETTIEIENIKKQKTKLLQELTIYKLSLPIKDKKIQLIEKQQIALLNENEILKNTLKTQVKQTQDLETIKNNQSKQIQELTAKLSSNKNLSNDEKNLLNLEIERLTNNIDLLNDQNNKLFKQILDLTQKLENETKELNENILMSKFTNETNIDKLKTIIKNNLALIIKLNIQNKNLNNQIITLQNENKQLLEEMKNKQQLTDDNFNLKGIITIQNSNIYKLRNKINSNDMILEEYKSIIQNQNEKISKYLLENQVSKDQISELQLQIQELQMAKLSLSNINQQQRLELETKIQTYEEELKNLKKQLDLKNQELEQIENKNKDLILKEIQDLKNTIINLKQQITDSKKKQLQELLNLEIKYKTEILNLTKFNKELTNKNLNNEQLSKQYETRIQTLTKELTEIQIQNGQLQFTINKLNSTLETLSLEKEQLTNINDNLKSQIEELNITIQKANQILQNQELQSDSKLQNYKKKIIELQKTKQLQFTTLNNTKLEIETQLLDKNKQLNECNNFKNIIQTQLEELLTKYKLNTPQSDNPIQKLEEYLYSLKTENQKLLLELETNLNKYNNEYESLNQKIQNLTEKIEILENDNRTLTEGFDLQVNELESTYNKKLESNLSKLRIEMETKQGQLNKFISNLEKYIIRTNNNLNFKEIQLQLQELNSKYTDDISNLKTLNIKLEFEKLNLSKKIQQLENSIDIINQSKINDNTNNNKLITELNDEIIRLKMVLEQKEISLQQLKLKSRSNETNLFNSITDISKKENELKKCKLALSKLEQTLELKNQEILDLNKNIIKLNTDIQDLKNQISDLQSQINLDKDNKSLEIERLGLIQNSLEQQLELLNTQILNQKYSYTDIINKLQTELTNCKIELTKCKNDLDLCKINLDTCNSNLKNIQTKLEKDLLISNNKLSQLESDKKNLENQLETLTSILAKGESNLRIENKKLLEENKQLKEKVSTSNSQVTKTSLPTVQPIPSDNIQIIYKYIEKPNKEMLNKSLFTTPFDKFTNQNQILV